MKKKKKKKKKIYAICASFQEYNSAPTHPLHDVLSSQAAKNLGFLIQPIYEDKEGGRFFCAAIKGKNKNNYLPD
jgi:hypothetical protein